MFSTFRQDFKNRAYQVKSGRVLAKQMIQQCGPVWLKNRLEPRAAEWGKTELCWENAIVENQVCFMFPRFYFSHRLIPKLSPLVMSTGLFFKTELVSPLRESLLWLFSPLIVASAPINTLCVPWPHSGLYSFYFSIASTWWWGVGTSVPKPTWGLAWTVPLNWCRTCLLIWPLAALLSLTSP